MNERDLTSSISNLYSKFFDLEKKPLPQCQCGENISFKILKLDLSVINYGICQQCNKISYFKEVNEFHNGKYIQKWHNIPITEIKTMFEEYLSTIIDQKELQENSSNFDSIITNIQKITNEKTLLKANFLNNKKN